MRFLKRFFIVLSCLLGVVFALYLVDAVSIEVAADVTDIVTLTPEQTLALYGDTVYAQYYSVNNTWVDTTFQYLGTSAGLVANGDNLAAGGYTAQLQQQLFMGNWLWYGCPATSDMQSSNAQFQFRFVPSVNVEGVAYFRQIIGSVRSSSHGSGYNPWRSSYYAACYTSYASPNQVFYGRGLDMSTTDSPVDVYFTPDPLHNNNSYAFTPSECAFSDIYLQNLVDGVEQTFSYTGLVFRPSRVVPVTVTQIIGANQNQIERNYYLFCMSCPHLTDGYVLPDVPSPTPDLSSQLDTLIDVQGQSNTILQQILIKLDLIYQQMQQGEATPTLQDPERIGFDSRTKQEILDGLHNGESALDGVAPSDLGAAAAGGMYDFWDRLTGVFPPGLMAVYMFALIGGIVSWVIFGKRGG